MHDTLDYLLPFQRAQCFTVVARAPKRSTRWYNAPSVIRALPDPVTGKMSIIDVKKRGNELEQPV